MSKNINLEYKNKNKRGLALALMESYRLQHELNNQPKSSNTKIVNYSSGDDSSSSSSSASTSGSENDENVSIHSGRNVRANVVQDSDATTAYAEVGNAYPWNKEYQAAVAMSQQQVDEIAPPISKRRKTNNTDGQFNVEELNKNIVKIVEQTLKDKFKRLKRANDSEN